MQAFHFGPPDRTLFAIHHPATGPTTRSSVLLCAPTGQEAVRCHRLGRVLAERLARNGHHVLRFDPFGSGDSGGEDTDLELHGWCGDVLAASAELQRRARVTSSVWVGIRLGASMAIRAAGTSGTGTPRMVLLDPVIDGSAALDRLRDRHVRAVSESYAFGRLEWQRRLSAERSAAGIEAIGFGLSPQLCTQLSQLGADSLALAAGTTVRVLAAASDSPCHDWAEAQRGRGCRVTIIPLEHVFDYASEEALNTALVPHDLVGALAEQVAAS